MVDAGEVIRQIEHLAPPSLAEEWDNCGLQVGDTGRDVGKVLVALTPLPEVFDEAEESGADFLLFHHPLIFSPLSSVDTASYPGNLVARAIRSDICVYAAHTSYDAAPDGVSVALADALDLRGAVKVVSPSGSLSKIVVFVPSTHVEDVAEAITNAGAGTIGDYTRCTFRTPGTGTFLPGDGTDPYLGERGRLEYADEFRLEAVVPTHLANEAVTAVRSSHPYEEVAFDLYPVDGFPDGCGYGRVGRLGSSMSSRELTDHVSRSLGFEARLVSDPKPVSGLEVIAVSGGSGGSFIEDAAASGADAYISGDLDYHDALLAESLGLTAIDAGHAATELPCLPALAGALRSRLDIPVDVSRVRK